MEGLDAHIGVEARIVGDESLEFYGIDGAFAFEHFDLQIVPGSGLENFCEFGGNGEAGRGDTHWFSVCIQRPVEGAIRVESREQKSAGMVAEPDAHRDCS
jgi:hypothetical protein